MGSEQLHELSAAYALDALDPHEREEFELHLSTCEALPRRRRGVHRDRGCPGVCRAACRSAGRGSAPTSCAVPPRTGRPPSSCRSAAAGSRSRSRPGSRSPRLRRSSSASGRAACTGSSTRSAPPSGPRARVAILGDPQASRRPLKGAGGELVVDRNGGGVLVMHDLAAAPTGKTYEAWVIAGGVAEPAGSSRAGTSCCSRARSDAAPRSRSPSSRPAARSTRRSRRSRPARRSRTRNPGSPERNQVPSRPLLP